MEIKRKKMTDDIIRARENALREGAEAIKNDYESKFNAFNCELILETGHKENEMEAEYKVFKDGETVSYDAGYVSRALFVVRRKKNETELKAEDELAQENREEIASEEELAAEEADTGNDVSVNAEEAEQLENDETLRESEDLLKRTVAFTEVMLVRSYLAFWVDWLSICDGFDDVRKDLDEFLDTLEEKEATPVE